MPKTRSTCVGRCTRLCSNNGRCNATRPPRPTHQVVVQLPPPDRPPITVGQIIQECIPPSAWTGSRVATWVDFAKTHLNLDVSDTGYLDKSISHWTQHGVWSVFTELHISNHTAFVASKLRNSSASMEECEKMTIREFIKIYVVHAMLCMWTHPEVHALRGRVDLMLTRIEVWLSLDIPNTTIEPLLHLWSLVVPQFTDYGMGRPVLSAAEIISRLNALPVAELRVDPLVVRLRQLCARV